MSQNPWWHPSDDDLGWDEPLPVINAGQPQLYGTQFTVTGETIWLTWRSQQDVD